jgi:hypothetical protein
VLWRNSFGWLPIRFECVTPNFEIAPARDFDAAVQEVRASGHTDAEWYWPPLISVNPPRPARVFSLPHTHSIAVNAADDVVAQQLGEFVVTVLGFLYGMLLTPGTWVNFYRVCVKPSRWQDFYVSASGRDRVLAIASDLWLGAPALRQEIFGVLRWHTFSFSYDHPFEVFMTQYMVVDACWRLHTQLQPSAPKAATHGGRIEALASFYDVTVPSQWMSSTSASALAHIRNELMHEARWGGAPVGFGHPAKPNDVVHLNLAWFNSRLILAILGDRSAYTRSDYRGGYQMLQ